VIPSQPYPLTRVIFFPVLATWLPNLLVVDVFK
jgi:hypothetical protein